MPYQSYVVIVFERIDTELSKLNIGFSTEIHKHFNNLPPSKRKDYIKNFERFHYITDIIFGLFRDLLFLANDLEELFNSALLPFLNQEIEKAKESKILF